MVEFDLSKITGREPPTDDGLPCACEWNAAGEPVGLCAAHQSKLDDELAALRAERDEANRVCEQWRQWSAGDQKQLAALRARVAELEAARQADEADAKRLGNENQRLRANLAQLWVRLGAIHGDAEKMLAGADPSAGGG